MKRRNALHLFAASVVCGSMPFQSVFASGRTDRTVPIGKMLQPIDRKKILKDDDWYIWGGSATQGPDGLFYLLYSRWPRSTTFFGWLTHSEIAVAVATSPSGPFVHEETALHARGKDYWDGHCTHNPHIKKFGDIYYLYYMGNVGDQKIVKDFNWLHRNNQRIGVATAKHPLGPWRRVDTPLVDVSKDPDEADALCLNNPSVTEMHDGRFLMIYKAVGRQGKLPFGGPVSHKAAIAAEPDGIFVKQPGLVFTAPGHDFPAEDPFIWYDGNEYRAIAKDMHGAFSGVGTALVEFRSDNGLDWSPVKNVLVTTPKIHWKGDKEASPVKRLERPQLYFEDHRPKVLYASVLDEDGTAYNVPIPLQS